MRSMRLAKREVKDFQEVRQILADCDIVRLGLTDADGMFIVPVNFGYEFLEETDGAGQDDTKKPNAAKEEDSKMADGAGEDYTKDSPGENRTGRLRLYIHSAREGRKAEAFAKCPVAALEMDCGHEIITGDYTCSYSYAYRSIMGSGRIREVTEPEEKIHGLTVLMEHMEPGASVHFLPEMLERVGVYCIDVFEYTAKKRERK